MHVIHSKGNAMTSASGFNGTWYRAVPDDNGGFRVEKGNKFDIDGREATAEMASPNKEQQR